MYRKLLYTSQRPYSNVDVCKVPKHEILLLLLFEFSTYYSKTLYNFTEIKYLYMHLFKIYHFKTNVTTLNIYMKEISFKMTFWSAQLRF